MVSIKYFTRLAALLSTLSLGHLLAQRQEVALTLGGILSQERVGPRTSLDLSSGLALQANYGYRVLESKKASLYTEVHFLANAQRQITSLSRSITQDVATLYVTPGIRLKLLSSSRVSPYAVLGGGYALYQQSTSLLNGAPNPAPRLLHRGALAFGGGADVRFWRFVSLRAEIRDFYTGSPDYNVASIHGGQHNLVASSGIVLRFR